MKRERISTRGCIRKSSYTSATYLVGEYAGLRMKREDNSLVSTCNLYKQSNNINRYLVGLYAGLRKKKRERVSMWFLLSNQITTVQTYLVGLYAGLRTKRES